MKRFLGLAVIAAAAACSGGAVSSRVRDVYGGDANWSAVEAPEKVSAYRVIRPGILKYIQAPETIAGFEITDGPLPVDDATVAELRSIFSDDSIYDFDRAKGCEFDPGVALRFARGAANLDVLLCFHCDELAAYVDTKRVGGEDFDRARPRLVAIAKRLFPGDEKIQELK